MQGAGPERIPLLEGVAVPGRPLDAWIVSAAADGWLPQLAAWAEGRARLEDERDERRAEMLDVEESVIGWDEAEATVKQAAGR